MCAAASMQWPFTDASGGDNESFRSNARSRMLQDPLKAMLPTATYLKSDSKRNHGPRLRMRLRLRLACPKHRAQLQKLSQSVWIHDSLAKRTAQPIPQQGSLRIRRYDKLVAQ